LKTIASRTIAPVVSISPGAEFFHPNRPRASNIETKNPGPTTHPDESSNTNPISHLERSLLYKEKNNNNKMESVKGSVIGITTAFGINNALTSIIPYAMSTLGTVVSGVGTLHTAGGITATLQTIAATTASGTFLGLGAVAGACIMLLKK